MPRLRQIIKELQRHRFGRRAETLPEDQLFLGLEEAEQVEADGLEADEKEPRDLSRGRVARRWISRGARSTHLPRIDLVIYIGSHDCPCGGNGLQRIGEDISEKLSASFRPSSAFW
jgi:hypothetical protein